MALSGVRGDSGPVGAGTPACGPGASGAAARRRASEGGRGRGVASRGGVAAAGAWGGRGQGGEVTARDAEEPPEEQCPRVRESGGGRR